MASPARHCWILTLGLAATSPAFADPNEVVVDGIEVHLGMMAAQRLRGYPRESVEAAMHGGIPKGSGFYHVNVALFDAATRAPIGNARVEAALEQPGLEGEQKRLEPMKINGADSYGQYFHLTGRAPPVIVVRIARPGTSHVTEARFRLQPD
jgi:hypothetical protein